MRPGKKPRLLGTDNPKNQALEILDPQTKISVPRTPDDYAQKSRSENTKRGYATDLKLFSKWCRERGLPSFPAEPSAVAGYITHRANQGRKVGTIRRFLSALATVHKRRGVPNPVETGEVQAVMEGIAREKGVKPTRKAPLTTDILRDVLEVIPDDLLGTRDKALLLIQFAAALRRSELVALEVEDLRCTPDGLILALKKSKTDQHGQGAEIGVMHGRHAETCPIRALKSWLAMSGITEGPVFRAISRHGYIGDKALTGGSVAKVIKKHIEAAGYDPEVYSGHSSRAGFITSAALAGASEHQIARTSRHKSMECLWTYIRPVTVFEGTASGLVGL